MCLCVWVCVLCVCVCLIICVFVCVYLYMRHAFECMLPLKLFPPFWQFRSVSDVENVECHVDMCESR